MTGNFSQSEMGEPILDTVLEAGDMLYFPRGTIHQVFCNGLFFFFLTCFNAITSSAFLP